ncbi:MAG TPA: hypothetical protein VEQ40_00070 [Pyrinomonadaceae bacterium]|nr:hypothetical protein [Pyrinomonadaceae bacterium]
MKSRRLFQYLFIVVLSLTWLDGVIISHAQHDWEKSTYQRWGKDEVKAVLEASPWSLTVKQSVPIAPLMMGADAPKFEGKIVFMLRSAMPVRQALLRRKQLEAKYDRMSETEKAEFDKKHNALLDCPACAQNYVVSVNSGNWIMSTNSFGQKGKGSVYLANEKGQRREAVHFAISNEKGVNEAYLFFPRLDDKGNPLLTPQSQTLTLSLGIKSSSDILQLPEKVEFDATKLVRDGKVIF